MMNSNKKVSEAVVNRLPRYYRHLSILLEQGFERISSNELAKRMKITASQIRQDLNNFGGFGTQGYGYNVRSLFSEIGHILGLNKDLSCVLVGAGNLGNAILNYGNFEKRGFHIKAVFDNNPDLIGNKINDFKILPPAQLKPYIKKNQIEIAMLTLPAESARGVLDDIISAGIKGIWNFSSLDIIAPESVALVNVHLSDSLMTLAYKINS